MTRFKANIPKPTFICKRHVLEQSLDNDVVINTMSFKTIDRRDEMKPYNVSDFSLHNLIAIGAPLNDVKMQGSSLHVADTLADTLANISESAFSNESKTE